MGGEQLLIFAVEAILVVFVLFGLFRARHRIGYAPLYLVIGSFQYLQTLLASTLYAPVAPDVLVSPGSAILFSAGVTLVLLIYVAEGALEARRLIFGLIAANVAVSGLCYVFAHHLSLPTTVNFLALQPETLASGARVLVAGTVVLALDIIGVVVLFEWLAKWLSPRPFLRFSVALLLALIFDALAFSTFAFFGTSEYTAILTANLYSKTVAAVFFAGCATLYLRFVDRPRVPEAGEPTRELRVLTYRERLEVLNAKARIDPLTGLRNRMMLFEDCQQQVSQALTANQPLAVVMLDVDGFKQLNDANGHLVGDAILSRIASCITPLLEDADEAYRYGGDEFLLVLPGADAARAKRLLAQVQSALGDDSPQQVSVTGGLALLGNDGATFRALLQAADNRMLRSKRSVVRGE